MTPRVALAALVFVSLARGDSKSEAALKAELAATQKALALATADRAAVQNQLAQSVADKAVVSRSIANLGASVKNNAANASAERTAAVVVVDANAAEARVASTAAALASARAEVAAVVAKAQADALLAAANSSKFTMYGIWVTSVMTFLTVALGLWAKDRADSRALAVTIAHRVETIEKIDEGQKASVEAIHQANHLTQKIVDMREDMVKAVEAVNEKTVGAASGKSWLDITP